MKVLSIAAALIISSCATAASAMQHTGYFAHPCNLDRTTFTTFHYPDGKAVRNPTRIDRNISWVCYASVIGDHAYPRDTDEEGDRNESTQYYYDRPQPQYFNTYYPPVVLVQTYRDPPRYYPYNTGGWRAHWRH